MHPRWPIAGSLICLTLLAGCAHGSAGHAPPTLNVETAPATRQMIETTLSLDGQIAPLEESTLAFQQSGPILAVYVNVGDRVTRGELLARIDDSTLRAQLAASQATAEQAGAQAQSRQITLPLTAQTNQSALAGAKAVLDNAQLTFRQSTQLFKQGYLSQSGLASARAALASAQSDFNRALGSVQGNAANVQAVAASAAAARAAAADVGLLNTEIGQTAMYAPFDGIVSARLLDPGAIAGPASPVLRVSRLDSVWVNINVPVGDLAFLQPGKPVAFTTTSLPGRVFNGRINAVNAVPTQGTLSYLARVREPNADGVFRGGMLVNVTVIKERHADALVVSRSAVATIGGASNLFIIKAGKAKMVPVQIGLQTQTSTEILSPMLAPGTPVITTRPDAMHDGSPVSGTPNAPATAAKPGKNA